MYRAPATKHKKPGPFGRVFLCLIVTGQPLVLQVEPRQKLEYSLLSGRNPAQRKMYSFLLMLSGILFTPPKLFLMCEGGPPATSSTEES